MDSVRVSKVTKASITLAKSHPPIILLQASGLVPTSGWINPCLGQWVYLVPPADGIQDVDFIVEKPSGIVMMVEMEISGSVAIGPVEPHDYWGKGAPLVGFRIHAAMNSIEILYSEAAKAEHYTIR